MRNCVSQQVLRKGRTSFINRMILRTDKVLIADDIECEVFCSDFRSPSPFFMKLDKRNISVQRTVSEEHVHMAVDICLFIKFRVCKSVQHHEFK
jgi:hypothetical protein